MNQPPIRRVKNPYELTVNFKSALFILALLIVLSVLAYTQFIVERLRDDSRHIVTIYTQMIAHIGEGDPEGEYSFVFEEIIRRIDFPIINTTPDSTPISWRNIEEVPGDTLTPVSLETLRALIHEMSTDNPPVPILYQGTLLGYIFYDTDSRLIRQLSWLPFVEIGVVGAFILIGYIGFSNIKRSEQRSIWIGMAKETAHQLGTPLSSLLGWIELLKGENEGREGALQILREMEVDLQRLDRVVSRFSQIGSASDLKSQPLVPLLTETVNYFRQRVPQSGKRITLVEKYEIHPSIYLNNQLFTWVIENIIKNAVDAIEAREGSITIYVHKEEKRIAIDVTDTGRGIDAKNFANIFRPGFSTKKRGWGLGLSLAKRIIEDYHGGKIFVRDSLVGEGTTIRILMREN